MELPPVVYQGLRVKVIVAKTAGFCMGVRRALGLVLEAAQKRTSLYTFGPLIHNNQVVQMLEAQGVRVIDDPVEARGGRAVLRAHGVTKQEAEVFEQLNVEVIDATCPKVQRSEHFVEKKASDGRPVIIVGDAGHAEVKALSSRAGDEVYVISSIEEAREVKPSSVPVIVAQTTFNEARYNEITAVLKEKYPEMEVLDSICSATHERQAEIRDLAARVDAIVVVGGRQSANTKRLAEIAQESGIPAFLIETADELPVDDLKNLLTVGVTAGASTPGWVTAEVVERLTSLGSRAWLSRMKLLFIDSGLTVSAVAVLAALFSQYLCGGFWGAGLLYVFFFMLCSYNLIRYFTGRRPYHTGQNRLGRLWVGGTAAIFGLVTIGTALFTEPWRTILKIVLLASIAAPFTYSLIVVRFKPGRLSVRDIPYLKDVSVGFAWFFTTAAVQWIYFGKIGVAQAVLSGTAVLLLGSVQSIMGDSQNLDTDRLLGLTTLAARIGKQRVNWVLSTGFVIVLALLGAAFMVHISR